MLSNKEQIVLYSYSACSRSIGHGIFTRKCWYRACFTESWALTGLSSDYRLMSWSAWKRPQTARLAALSFPVRSRSHGQGHGHVIFIVTVTVTEYSGNTSRRKSSAVLPRPGRATPHSSGDLAARSQLMCKYTVTVTETVM
jgi:hypothetical protein